MHGLGDSIAYGSSGGFSSSSSGGGLVGDISTPDIFSASSYSSGSSYSGGGITTVDIVPQYVSPTIGGSYSSGGAIDTGGWTDQILPNTPNTDIFGSSSGGTYDFGTPRTQGGSSSRGGGFDFGNFLHDLTGTAAAIAPLFVHQQPRGSYHQVQHQANAQQQQQQQDQGAPATVDNAAPATDWTPWILAGGALAIGGGIFLFMHMHKKGRR